MKLIIKFVLINSFIAMSISNNLNSQSTNFNKIAIVYPEKLPEKREILTSFYDEFLQLLINSKEISEITIIHRQGLKEKLIKAFPSTKVKLFEYSSVRDIWIRDFAPFLIIDSIAYKGIYNPSYFMETNRKTSFLDDEKTIFYYASFDDNVGRKIAEQLGFIVRNVSITIDGGNFIHNGSGIGITTNRIVSENESMSIQEINDFFKENFGIKKLIILPVEPGDETGHIDGMVRFIDSNTVIVAEYEQDYKEGHDFMNKIAKLLSSEFNVVRVLNETPKPQSPDEFVSAFGNYINFLQVGNTIFLPQYGIIDKDKAAIQILEKYFKVVSVKKDIDKLSKLGGVLNCITWNY